MISLLDAVYGTLTSKRIIAIFRDNSSIAIYTDVIDGVVHIFYELHNIKRSAGSLKSRYRKKEDGFTFTRCYSPDLEGLASCAM